MSFLSNATRWAQSPEDLGSYLRISRLAMVILRRNTPRAKASFICIVVEFMVAPLAGLYGKESAGCALTADFHRGNGWLTDEGPRPKSLCGALETPSLWEPQLEKSACNPCLQEEFILDPPLASYCRCYPKV